MFTDPPAVGESYSYDGYGVMLSSGNSAVAASDAETSLLYTGEQYDDASQSYYLRARYYNPLNGLFNQMDPYAGNMSDPQSLHKYAYVHNNPVNGIDPSGMYYSMAETTAITLITWTLYLNFAATVIPFIGGFIAAWIMGVSLGEYLAALLSLDTWKAALLGLGFGYFLGHYLEKIAEEMSEVVLIWIGFFMALFDVIMSIMASYEMIQTAKKMRLGFEMTTTARLVIASYLAVLTISIMLTLFLNNIPGKINKMKEKRTEFRETMSLKDQEERTLAITEINGKEVKVKSSLKGKTYDWEDNPKTITIEPIGKGGKNHAEHKLLNIANEQLPDDYSGRLTFYIDKSPCPDHCQPLLNQFEDSVRPNIKIDIFYETKYIRGPKKL